MKQFFNRAPSYTMHIDLNSCFASIEQQANPFLRGKPLVVAAYNSPGSCIIASSIEAKKLGIRVGMKVKEGRRIYPKLVVLLPDPHKYRFINRKLLALLQEYSSKVEVCSIDEMVIDFSKNNINTIYSNNNLQQIAWKIKTQIKKEIGEWLTVSIGISTNRFWAKLASSLEKPDGLVEINYRNVEIILSRLKLAQIQGIKDRNIYRLNQQGIYTPLQFYYSPVVTLKRAFGGIVGYYWYLRLHGFEIDNIESARKSYGNSYALYKATADPSKLLSILHRLVEKMGKRLRYDGYTASGIHVGCLFTDNTYWHQQRKSFIPLYTNRDLLKNAYKILLQKPQNKLVKILSVSCLYLQRNLYKQTSFLPDEIKKYNLTQAIDKLNDRYGDFVVTSARTINMENKILDRIAFGGVKELEDFIFEEPIKREVYLP